MGICGARRSAASRHCNGRSSEWPTALRMVVEAARGQNGPQRRDANSLHQPSLTVVMALTSMLPPASDAMARSQ